MDLDPAIWGRLPPDLHFLFIDRLPLRSISRLRTVSKSWNKAWFYLVIKNEGSKNRDEEWENAAWWQVLSKIKDHKSQVILSTVSRDWERNCRSLPALKIEVPECGKRKAVRFISSALRSRSKLRKLEIRYVGSSETRTGIPEHEVLALLQPFRMELEELNLSLLRNRFFRLWRHVGGRFPKLVKLNCNATLIGAPSVKTFTSLKDLDLMMFDIQITTVQEICRRCPSLERLSIFSKIHGLELDNAIFSLESKTIKVMYLTQNHDFSKAGLMIFMPVLKTVSLYNIKLLEAQESEILEHLSFPLVPEPVVMASSEKLRSLTLSKSKLGTCAALQRVFKMTPRVTRMRLMSDFYGEDRVSLKKLLPPQLELLYFESNLMQKIDCDGEHWDQIGEEVVLREGRGEEMFGLKQVAFDLRDMERSEEAEKRLVSIVAQMLRCSPALEHIALSYRWEFGERQWLDGALWSFRASDDRLVLSWSGPGIDFFDERCFRLVGGLMLWR